MKRGISDEGVRRIAQAQESDPRVAVVFGPEFYGPPISLGGMNFPGNQDKDKVREFALAVNDVLVVKYGEGGVRYTYTSGDQTQVNIEPEDPELQAQLDEVAQSFSQDEAL